MTKITFLHFSDVHWHPSNSRDIEIVRDAMLRDLEALKAKTPLDVDFVVFTGDLVLAGENEGHFKEAHEHVVAPILNTLGVPESLYFTCPGNHDISRAKARSSEILEAGLRASLTSTEALNRFLDKVEQDSAADGGAMDRMAPYQKYESELTARAIKQTPFIRAHQFDVRGVQVGLASLNNSWRASGEAESVDRHNLLMGERSADAAAAALEGCEVKIALFHHPLDWLAEFDSASVSPRMYSSFDVLAFGHVHGIEPTVRNTLAGTSVMCQSGSFYAQRKHYNGYQIVALDTQTCEAELQLRTYFDAPNRRYGAAENITESGVAKFHYAPKSKGANPELERFLRDVRSVIRANALQQFNISDLGAHSRSDPHAAFICPPILVKEHTSTNGSASQASKLTSPETDDTPTDVVSKGRKVELHDILTSNGNYVIHGAREIGKTSLAHYSAVLTAEASSQIGMVPIVIDYRSFRPNEYGTRKAASSYLQIGKAGYDFDRALAKGELLFLIDNYSGALGQKKAELEALIEKYPTCRWILFADTRVGGTNPEVDDNDLVPGFKVAHIKTLPRRSIREMTRRWCRQTGADDEETFSSLMAQMKSSGLPRTGYIVTLLLWSMHQDRKMERINEAVLVMNMVDFLLGKADFTRSLEREFDATSKEITLQSLASFLSSQGGVVSSNEAASFLIDFFTSRGLAYDAGSVLNSLCDCGVLTKEDGVVKFKYRCFQEYFHARYIGSSSVRLKSAILNRAYLDFGRELEMLSGLMRENELLIDELYMELTKYAPKSIEEINLDQFDELVAEETGAVATHAKIRKIRNTRLSADQIDDLVDAAEARLAKSELEGDEPSQKPAEASSVKETERTSAQRADRPQMLDSPITQPKLGVRDYLSTIELLGRVLRNSEFTEKQKKISASMAYLSHSARLFLLLLNVLSEVLEFFKEKVAEHGEPLAPEEEVALKYLFAKRFLLMTSSQIGTEFAAEKMIPIYDAIDKHGDTSNLERALLVALYLDAGHELWNERWEVFIRGSKKHRFTLEFLVDKLWEHIHTRVVSTAKRKRIENIVADVELALGKPKAAKSRIMAIVRSAAAETERKEG